ncbi:5-methylcytosine-specific restriction enzyme A [Aeromicrobium choanae]|uniref:5-methylcytosine-specific restriction enzyme A n=2 Tax=Aeromicrobium choanae TaxID=1736691 RepID=A0A1T4Z289_9ACTN|nr:5-methylcytosine-specific restriction enzyme A [Aeromicrobium choanae]
MEEYDRIGRREFLAKYGFATTAKYFVVHDGKRYDAKALTGAAHGYQHGEAMRWDDFSGGLSTVVRQLRSLDFEVDAPARSPEWARDELILTLDLYFKTRGHLELEMTSSQVVDLSEELRSLPVFDAATRSLPAFRNPSEVALKLHNFAALDPAQGGTGIGQGLPGDHEIWAEWAHRPDELFATAVAIRADGHAAVPEPPTSEEEEYEADEGRILYRLHRRRERDRKIVKAKKDDVLSKTGKLACEVCGFESALFYGPDVADLVDVHHVVPLHKIGASKTRLADLAIVCPNCHRAIHKHRPFVTPAELKAKRDSAVSSLARSPT